jgi:putative oxidoreductase
MKFVRTLLRLLIGGVFIGHGGQKLLGWFGGEGFAGTVEEMKMFRLEPARPLAAAASTSEFGAGIMLVAGFMQPVACTFGCSSMLTAIWSACLPNGFFVRDGGLEYPLVLASATLLLAAEGPGPLSLDRLLGQERSGPGVAAGCLAVAAAGSAGVYLLTAPGRNGAPAPEEVAEAA